MVFHSILYDTPQDKTEFQPSNMPEYFVDLNLDQIIREILQEKAEYHLESFFYNKPDDITTINYRLQVMKELENEDMFNSIRSFSRTMKKVREYIGFSQNIHNKLQMKKWHLDSISVYCKAVMDLNTFLKSQELKSSGLKSFKQWLDRYANTKSFCDLHDSSFALSMEFSSIKYSMEIERDRIVVNADESTNDYSLALIKTFKQINDSTFDYKISFFTELEMCRLETGILEIVQKMNMEIFNKLEAYYVEHLNYIDPLLMNFDREIQFYISYLEYIRKLKQKGFNFAYPNISNIKEFAVIGGYDLALASKPSGPIPEIIPNDFCWYDNERIAVLTGPNQGGKTTYARAFGQILYLASIGCPVPCQKANIFLFDRIFTHFSEEEKLDTHAGRLKEELARLRQVLGRATSNSVIIINELFATTTSFDAYTMGKKVLDYFIGLDCFCLYVTHIFELTKISSKVVSFVANVDIENKETRTYKIIRKTADGQAYANTIAEKYHLSYKELKERITI